ncbi:MAG: hypothetical protein AAF211_25180, partial [Myxococcota bacterium]
MDRDALFEQVLGAFRATDAEGRIRATAAFHDLDATDRLRAFEDVLVQRQLEAALDRQSLST